MDTDVIAAMARWPDVPHAYGWLSLDARGRWRLHPLGDAANGGPGEPITNEQILAFMGRNYSHTDDGRWYFQNGPQRVYVRLDGAPLIAALDDQAQGLQDHTGRALPCVTHWWLDEEGWLYASTPEGPARVLDRDLAAVLDRLHAPDGTPLLDALAADQLPGQVSGLATPDGPVPILRLTRDTVAQRLGFDPAPAQSGPSTTH